MRLLLQRNVTETQQEPGAPIVFFQGKMQACCQHLLFFFNYFFFWWEGSAGNL